MLSLSQALTHSHQCLLLQLLHLPRAATVPCCACCDHVMSYLITPAGIINQVSVTVNEAGQMDSYANVLAGSFGVAVQSGSVSSFTTSATAAISMGDSCSCTQQAFGLAIAKAVSSGGSQASGVVQATCSAFCAGGSTADAWASAFAIALSNADCCSALSQAYAQAQGQCADALGNASEAVVTVLGFCGAGPTDGSGSVEGDGGEGETGGEEGGEEGGDASTG